MSKIAPFVLILFLTACSKKVETRVIFPEGNYGIYRKGSSLEPFSWRNGVGRLTIYKSYIVEFDDNGAAGQATFRIKKGKVGGGYYIYFSDMKHDPGNLVILSSGAWRYDDYENLIMIDGHERAVVYLQDIDDPYGSAEYILLK